MFARCLPDRVNGVLRRCIRVFGLAERALRFCAERGVAS